jgi:formylglycine-generating enzyme required for sulfatase activity
VIYIFEKEFFMSFFTRNRLVILIAAIITIAIPEISYAQLDLKAKAVETLTNGVMKELDKKFAEMVAKEALSAAVKANIVKNLSEMSRPVVKNVIDGASSGKLPNVTEVVNSVMRDITPRVQELVKVALTDGGAGSMAQVAGQASTTASASTAVIVGYDDEKDFTVEIIKESNSVRITKYNGKNTELKIPPRIGDRPVTEIGERVFVKKGLVSVVIPESVIFIGNLAFADNQIGSVSIGSNVYIANNAFENTGYNSFSAGFYNNQGRKSGIYSNSWRWVSAIAAQPAVQQAAQPAAQSAHSGVNNTAPAITPAVSVVIPATQTATAQQTDVPTPANMVRINGGTFMMGSPIGEQGRNINETQHQVTVSSFFMGKYEVTQGEYKKIMGTNPSIIKGDKLPVENVSWYDVITYCNALSQSEGLTPAYTIDNTEKMVTWNRNANGYRLPTEAEWEYACRAGTNTPFNTGTEIPKNGASFHMRKTTTVGSYKPNAWGLYDMHGNVSEWCWDWFGDYPSVLQIDPVGAFSGTNRIQRGGSWDNYGEVYLRSALRSSSIPDSRSKYDGFRIVR